jgi:hypothetical protein
MQDSMKSSYESSTSCSEIVSLAPYSFPLPLQARLICMACSRATVSTTTSTTFDDQGIECKNAQTRIASYLTVPASVQTHVMSIVNLLLRKTFRGHVDGNNTIIPQQSDPPLCSSANMLQPYVFRQLMIE